MKEHMLDAKQLDVAHFPTISFVSTAVERGAKGDVLVGKLTVRGVERAVRVPFSATRTADGVIIADATFRVHGSSFGLKPYSAFLGAVKNRDELDFHLHVVTAAPR